MESTRMHPSVVMYDYAMQFVGKPYLWGGDDPIGGFDCSGLCIELLQAAGVFPRGLDATARQLHDMYPEVLAEPKFGGLAFFGIQGITHVGFCLNNLLMLEAGGGGSKTVSVELAEVQNAYIRVRPIASRKDLVTLKQPPYPWR